MSGQAGGEAAQRLENSPAGGKAVIEMLNQPDPIPDPDPILDPIPIPDPIPVPDLASAEMIVIEPAHHLTFDEPPEVQGIMFDPDGVTAYVHLFAQYINLWDMLLGVMPWIMLAVGGIVVFVTLRIGSRRIKNRDIVGRFYCRKCGYELETQEPRSVCPECGVDPADRAPRPGKSLLRRLAIPVVTAVVTLPVCGVVGIVSPWVPQNMVFWPSRKLAELAAEKGWSRLDPFLGKGDWVRRFNMETGEFGRTVCERPGLTYFRMTISPDGSVLYRKSRGIFRNSIERVDIESGRTIGRLTLSEGGDINFGAPAIIGHERDGKDAMVFYMDRSAKKHRLIRWDLETDTQSVVFEEEAWISDSEYPTERDLIPVSPKTGGVYLSAPAFMESYSRGLHEFRLLDASGTVVRTIERTGYGHRSPPVVSSDGQWMFNSTGLGGTIEADNPSTGETQGTLRFTGAEVYLHNLILAPDDRYLLMLGDDVLIRDVQAKQWVAKLNVPDELIAPNGFLSADANWYAVVSQRNPTAAEAARGVQFSFDLVIWDVSQFNMADARDR